MSEYKGPVLVSGSRSIKNYDLFCRLIKQTSWEITELIHGGAKGVDSLAARYCKENKILEIKMEADWNNYGNAAGPLRNQQMVDLIKEKGGKVFVLHDGKSSGARHCKEYAESKGLEVYYCVLNKKDNYTIHTLEELDKKLENAKLINAETARNLIRQLIETKKEYIQVAQDYKRAWIALEDASKCKDKYSEMPGISMINSQLIKEALETPTAKYLEKQNEQQNI